MTRIIQVNGHGLYAPVLNQHTVVLDLGANKGQFSAELASRFGCSVIMVEANPELSAQLEQTGAAVRNVAVGGMDGVAAFNVSTNPEASSLLPLPGESVYGATLARTIEVDVVSLSSLLRSTGRVDVLKIDIEGAEVDALNSAGDAELKAIGQITVEFHDDVSFHFELGDAVSALIKRFERLGFTYLQFNRPARTNALFLGPALGLSAFDSAMLKVRYDYFPAVVQAGIKSRSFKWISRWGHR